MRGRPQRSGRLVTELVERQQERVVLTRVCVLMIRARKGAKLLAQLYLDVHLGVYNLDAIAVDLFGALWRSNVDANFHERAVVAPLSVAQRIQHRESECVGELGEASAWSSGESLEPRL